MSESKIRKFYEFSTVFITGGTGFLGRILIEKLLRSTEVSTIYILVRIKRGMDVSSRVDAIFNDEHSRRLAQHIYIYEGHGGATNQKLQHFGTNRHLQAFYNHFNIQRTDTRLGEQPIWS